VLFCRDSFDGVSCDGLSCDVAGEAISPASNTPAQNNGENFNQVIASAPYCLSDNL
jgi:hypothetical protein